MLHPLCCYWASEEYPGGCSKNHMQEQRIQTTDSLLGIRQNHRRNSTPIGTAGMEHKRERLKIQDYSRVVDLYHVLEMRGEGSPAQAELFHLPLM